MKHRKKRHDRITTSNFKWTIVFFDDVKMRNVAITSKWFKINKICKMIVSQNWQVEWTKYKERRNKMINRWWLQKLASKFRIAKMYRVNLDNKINSIHKIETKKREWVKQRRRERLLL